MKILEKRDLYAIITDHDTMRGYAQIKKSERVFPGEEVNTGEGEVIGAGISEEVPRGLGLEETVDRIRELGGVVIVPHPFDLFRKGVLWRINRIKGAFFVEGWNSRAYIPLFNRVAVRYAEHRGLSWTSGSDAHFYRELGRGTVETEGFEEFLKGKFRVRDRRWSWWDVHVRTQFAKRSPRDL